MTQPKTSECIEWLRSLLKVAKFYTLNDTEVFSRGRMDAIIAQLLAAQEMAKALDSIQRSVYSDSGSTSKATKALTAWREAGGQ